MQINSLLLLASALLPLVMGLTFFRFVVSRRPLIFIFIFLLLLVGYLLTAFLLRLVVYLWGLLV